MADPVVELFPQVAPVALEHYRRAAWVSAGHDDDANVEIRASADAGAAGGPAELADRVRADLVALPAALEQVLSGGGVPDPVPHPHDGGSRPLR